MEESIETLAKYPFIPEASEYFKVKTGTGDILLADFEKTEFEDVVIRAEERIREALDREEVSYKSNVYVELLSFPLSLAIVKAVGDSFLSQRYASAEAKRLIKLLQNEKTQTIFLKIANEVLMWRAEYVWQKAPYDYALNVRDYLQIAPNFRDRSWKLINKPIRDGYVYLTRGEFTRLMAEGIKNMIEDELEDRFDKELPGKLGKVVNRIRLLVSEKRPKAEGLEEFKGRIVLEAFPPCIGAFYQALVNGQHLPHTARFAVTSFLLNIGVDPEDIVKLFTKLPDANERITRYQVEHIAGLRGSKTKYTAPKCETLKTHGLCVEDGRFCGRIKHPLSYYRRAIRRVGRVGEGEKSEVSEKPIQEVL